VDRAVCQLGGVGPGQNKENTPLRRCYK
jgi:hypothetical protein